MKSTKGTINEALAQVANYNKKQRPVVEAETLDERETDKYGNAKLSDADKDKIGKLRQKIKDHEILADRLRDEISQIKKAAGVDH
jgi:hypothetical protein